MPIRPSKLRAKLNELDDVEIDALCLDHFPAVYDKFGRGLQRTEKINLLLNYCRTRPFERERLCNLLKIEPDNSDSSIASVKSKKVATIILPMLIITGLIIVSFVFRPWGFLFPSIAPDETMKSLTLQLSSEPSLNLPPDQPPPNAKLGDTWTRPNDQAVMVYVPEGEFLMGSTEVQVQQAIDQCVNDGFEQNTCEIRYSNEMPQHPIIVKAFWLDRYEVTNSQYNQCVENGDCAPSNYIENPEYNKSNYPIVGVSWRDARNYCDWAHARLPTEPEWEYAARGEQSFLYPWGNNFDGGALNFCDTMCSGFWKATVSYDGYTKTAPVGSFVNGVSWCGTFDLAGNVWEWTSSLYQDYPYMAENERNDTELGGIRILRGGSWYSSQYFVRGAKRLWFTEEVTDDDIGFRCVRDSE